MVTRKLSVFGTNRDLIFFRYGKSLKIVLTDPLKMSIVSERFLIVNRRFLTTRSLIFLTWSSSVDIDGRPGRYWFPTRSRPSWNYLPLVNIFFDIFWSPEALCNILNVTAAEYSFRKQNLPGVLVEVCRFFQ